VVREELTMRLRPDTISELNWYFNQYRGTSDRQALARADERFWLAGKAFSAPRWHELYRRWLTDGDIVFEGLSSTAIAEALEPGTARIESQVLLFSYSHLAPLVAVRYSSREEVDEEITAAAQPEAPLPPAMAVSDESTRDWYRLVAARRRELRDRSRPDVMLEIS
jgi:hypothetical protein